MLTPRVQDLIERCRRAQEAADAYAPLVDERLRAESVDPEPCPPGTHEASLRRAGDDIGKAADAAAAADLAHSRAVEAHRGHMERRDALVAALYRDIVDLRRAWRPQITKKDEKGLFGISGKTPRGPINLVFWTQAVLIGWRTAERRFEDMVRKALSTRIARIRRLHDELETEDAAATDAGRTRDVARGDRLEAIEECERALQVNGHFVESFLMRVGRRDLVTKIRGKGPRGRPKKGDAPRRTAKTVLATGIRKVGSLLSWFGWAARKAGRVVRRAPEEDRDLGRAA